MKSQSEALSSNETSAIVPREEHEPWLTYKRPTTDTCEKYPLTEYLTHTHTIPLSYSILHPNSTLFSLKELTWLSKRRLEVTLLDCI